MQPKFDRPLVVRQGGAILLDRGAPRQLGAMAQEAPRKTAAGEALALAEATRLELAETSSRETGVNETKMRPPDAEGTGALEMSTAHD